MNTITSASVSITEVFCKKMSENIPSRFVSALPMVSIHRIEKSLNTYRVNITTYLPSNITPLTDSWVKELNLNSGLFLDEKKIYLSYKGVRKIDTLITKAQSEQSIFCRRFDVEYYTTEKVDDHSLYHIQFNYKLPPNSQLADAIIVINTNEDPETDRGTVTSVRTDDQ
ncbi:hypothetical protein [Abyssalbus ytuae]|uniref:Uncharacterized protein n=1 Tax=Abyssalbus ytuae TaxID=2926907 RepID=A0A9E7CUF5_9FLAO|nr:hypothetical protein [Abyssalbus ytuae]UOB18327.1 hypothetical protein MQE35_03330 [Abyssalbus ytuae]